MDFIHNFPLVTDFILIIKFFKYYLKAINAIIIIDPIKLSQEGSVIIYEF